MNTHVLILTISFILKPFLCTACYEIIEIDKARELASIENYQGQVPKNHANIYQLDSGKLLVKPQGFSVKQAIIFDNRACLDQFIVADKYPIENTDEQFFDYDPEGISQLPQSLDKYLNHLNQKYKQDFEAIDEETALYAAKMLRRKAKRLSGYEQLALLMIISEYARAYYDCTWVLEKQYGTMNPYYNPLLLDKNNRVFDTYKIGESVVFDKDMNLDFFSHDLFWTDIDLLRKAGKVFIEPKKPDNDDNE